MTIDMRHKPYHLPQITAPFNIVLDKLDGEEIDYDLVDIHPNDLNPLQGIVYSDEVEKIKLDDLNPIWISANNEICDGHHRYFRAALDDVNLKAIKINLNYRDASRILNKIQDIYEYEQSKNLEEVEVQDTINFYDNDENQFLNKLEEDNLTNQDETTSRNPQTIIGYRQNSINENSVVGNFFYLKPIDKFDKYEIIFDNLLDTNILGLNYKDGQQPTDILAKIWFPNINFEKISQENGIPSINLKNKAIVIKAKKMGYDGIKYGDTLLQGLK